MNNRKKERKDRKERMNENKKQKFKNLTKIYIGVGGWMGKGLNHNKEIKKDWNGRRKRRKDRKEGR